MKTSPTPVAREPAQKFKELISFRVNMLASTWSRLTAESNQRDFGLDPREWRILGMLGGYAPMSLLGLAKEVNIDKSQASRTVSSMIKRDLLRSVSDETDGRGVQLSLTSQGKALYRKVFPRAVKRNELLLSVLTEKERLLLDRALEVLTAHAYRTLAEDRKIGAASTRPPDKPPVSRRATRLPTSLKTV